MGQPNNHKITDLEKGPQRPPTPNDPATRLSREANPSETPLPPYEEHEFSESTNLIDSKSQDYESENEEYSRRARERCKRVEDSKATGWDDKWEKKKEKFRVIRKRHEKNEEPLPKWQKCLLFFIALGGLALFRPIPILLVTYSSQFV